MRPLNPLGRPILIYFFNIVFLFCPMCTQKIEEKIKEKLQINFKFGWWNTKFQISLNILKIQAGLQ